MGRHRKSTEELERRGAFAHDPARAAARAAEPVPQGALGPPPAEFLNPHSPTSVALLACWNEVLEAAKEVRLTSADRLHVEMTARQIYKCRRPGAKAGDFGQLDRFLGKLGLNPADRSRVQGVGKQTTEEQKQGWQAIAAGGDCMAVQ